MEILRGDLALVLDVYRESCVADGNVTSNFRRTLTHPRTRLYFFASAPF